MRSTLPVLLFIVSSLGPAASGQISSPSQKLAASPTSKTAPRPAAKPTSSPRHRVYRYGTYKKINALQTVKVTSISTRKTALRHTVAPVVSAELRAAAYTLVYEHMSSASNHFDSTVALQPFFDRLSQSNRSITPAPSAEAIAETSQSDANQASTNASQSGQSIEPIGPVPANPTSANTTSSVPPDVDQSIHILQYGDSHTASDDWVESMRAVFQNGYGDGGPGFTMAGHPFKGYRRFDIRGASSPGWVTQGTMGHAGDGANGLSGVSVTATHPGETLSLTTSGDVLELYYLRQPGGGSFTVEEDGLQVETVDSNGDTTTGVYTIHPTPGEHTYNVRTLSYAPVRLFGWVSENRKGVTWETLGINGAQASMLLNWNQVLWTQQIRRRNPALVLIAYGTNEALSPSWTAEDYRNSLLQLIAQFRQAVPNASLLLVGPPDCGRLHSFPHLGDVIDIQRDVAHETGIAFWDWRHHMGGPGATHMWVRAGLSQPDYTHLTGDGYKLLGQTLATEIDREYRRYLNEPVAEALPVRNAAFVQ